MNKIREIYLENTKYNPDTGETHNKFYRMTQYEGKDGFEAEYGVIGGRHNTKWYPLEKWSEVLSKRVNPGGNKVPYDIIRDDSFPTSGKNVDSAKLEKALKGIDRIISAIENYIAENGESPVSAADKKQAEKTREMVQSFQRFESNIASEMNSLWESYREYAK